MKLCSQSECTLPSRMIATARSWIMEAPMSPVANIISTNTVIFRSTSTCTWCLHCQLTHVHLYMGGVPMFPNMFTVAPVRCPFLVFSSSTAHVAVSDYCIEFSFKCLLPSKCVIHSFKSENMYFLCELFYFHFAIVVAIVHVKREI